MLNNLFFPETKIVVNGCIEGLFCKRRIIIISLMWWIWLSLNNDFVAATEIRMLIMNEPRPRNDDIGRRAQNCHKEIACEQKYIAGQHNK